MQYSSSTLELEYKKLLSVPYHTGIESWNQIVDLVHSISHVEVIDKRGDIILVVGESMGRIQVSSRIMATFSPVFNAMLYGRFKEAIDLANS